MGDRTNAVFSYDATTAGFSQNDMPLGFYVEKCRVQSRSDASQGLFLIGTNYTGVLDGCPMDSSEVDLHISESHQNGTFSLTDYGLAFDAFKFGDAGDMSLNCLFRLCLTADCATESVPVCTPQCYTPHSNDMCEEGPPNFRSSTETSLEDCGLVCQNDQRCEYFNWNPTRSACDLFADCDSLMSDSDTKSYAKDTSRPGC